MAQTYDSVIKPFLVAQMARVDRALRPVVPKKGEVSGSSDAERVLKNFILETVTHLIDCINDKQEEANILRSISSKYESIDDSKLELERAMQAKMDQFIVEKTAEIQKKAE